jgi:hypothetical protein
MTWFGASYSAATQACRGPAKRQPPAGAIQSVMIIGSAI